MPYQFVPVCFSHFRPTPPSVQVFVHLRRPVPPNYYFFFFRPPHLFLLPPLVIMSSNIGKLDIPIWHGCQGHAFADYEEALTNYSIQTGTVSCLFSDKTGVIESDEQKCKQHNAVMMMALQKGAGVQWQQLRAVYTQAVEAVDAVEAEGETAAIVAVTGHAKGTPYYDAAATWANFRTHAQGKTDTTAGPALFKEVDAWSFPTTGTHVDNVAQAITELTAFQLRGQTLNDDDFQLSAAHLAHTFKSHLPGEFAIHSRHSVL